MAGSDSDDSKRDLTPTPTAEKTAATLPSESAQVTAENHAAPVAAASVATPVAASVEAPPGRLLKRQEAAELLGMSPTTFRRRIENVELVPIIQNGVHLYPEVTVTEFAVRYRRERFLEGDAPIVEDRGKLTAIVFDLLDQAVAPVDVVKRLERPGPEIEELHAQWARMRGMVVLNGEQIEKLRSLDWSGSKAPPIDSGEKLVRFIQDLNTVHGIDAQNCEACRAVRARICVACARIQVERIKAETRRQAEESKAHTRRYAEDAKTERARLAAAREPEPRPRKRTIPGVDDEKDGSDRGR